MKMITVSLTAFMLATSSLLQAMNLNTPSCECRKGGAHLSLEYLYWKVQEEQLYPVIIAENLIEKGVNVTDISVRNQNFDYTSGFRVTLALPYHTCDLKLAWTRIHPRTTTTFSTSYVQDLIASFFRSNRWRSWTRKIGCE